MYDGSGEGDQKNMSFRYAVTRVCESSRESDQRNMSFA